MNIRFALLFLPLLFISCSEGTPDVPEEEVVRKTFEYYRQGILAGSGAEAFQWVDRNTVDYYNRILALATTADSATVRALDIQDRYMVQRIRHSISKETALGMDGATLFAYAVENGMVGDSRLSDLEIGDVTITGDTATGAMIVKGKPSGLAFTFHKENGLWKIDLTSLFPAARTAFRNLQAASGKNEDEFIAFTLEFQTEVKPGPQIWQPMKEREK